MGAQPLKIMYLNPVGENDAVDTIFAAMARALPRPGGGRRERWGGLRWFHRRRPFGIVAP